MAVKLADVYVAIRGDSSEYEKELGHAEKQTKRFGGVMQGILQGAGMAAFNLAAKGVQTFVGGIGDAISGASDLSETISKTGVLFGDSADEIEAWSKTAATSFGQSQQQALDAATTFATFGKAAGLGGQQLVDFSTDFTELASDLASFNNTSPEQAIEAIGAALRGESEPLRAYGVLLDDASMRQKALELGIISTTKDALTPQQKVLAAQALIYEQTAAAQGDFARTSDGLANSQRILEAQWTDMKTTMGSALLPIVTALVTSLNGLATAVIPPLAAWIEGTLVPAAQRLADVLGPLVSSIGNAVALLATGDFTGGIFGLAEDDPAIGALFTFRDAILGLWQGAQTLIAGLTGSFAESLTSTGGRFGDLGEKVSTIMALLQSVVSKALAFIQAFWEKHGAAIMHVVGNTFDTALEIVDTVLDTILGVVKLALQLLNGDFEGAGKTLVEIVERLWEGVKTVFSNQFDSLRTLVTEFDWGALGTNIMTGIKDGILRFGSGILEALRGKLQNAIEGTKRWFGIQSPSKRTANEVGRPLAEGITQGFAQALDRFDLAAQLQVKLDGLRLAAVGAGSVTNIFNNNSQNFAFDQVFGTQPDFGLTRQASRDGVLSALRSRGA